VSGLPPRLVLATRNAAKGAELAALLAGLDYRIETLATHPAVTLPPEGTTSYADNARDKARAATAGTACVAVGDDSGLEVDALGGGPGVASARYGGPGLDDGGRLRHLLAALPPGGPRTARFRCLLALTAPWGEEHVVEGVVEGVLITAPRGAGGFGYDPIFLVPALGRTFGELGPADKARWSHRARAVALARPILAGWAARARPLG
jgi:XTP/dITP diphosphohydrolase